MVSIGTPGTRTATKILPLGAGEPGREVAIEAMRLGAAGRVTVSLYP